MPYSVSMPIGVIVARQEVDHPWQDYAWHAVAVMPGAAPVEAWQEVARGPGYVHYHAGTVLLELFRKETEAYIVNLTDSVPSVYVVLREDDEGEWPLEVHLATVSPFEAQDYEDSGEEIVAAIAMPPLVLAWLEHFVSAHHAEEKFVKRKRDEVKMEDHKFGQEPLHVLRHRQAGGRDDE